MNMKKSGTTTPHVELQEIGVSLDLKLRRTQFAAADVRRHALKVPKAAKIGKTKNISHDMAGTKMATVHMTKQNIAEMPQVGSHLIRFLIKLPEVCSFANLLSYIMSFKFHIYHKLLLTYEHIY